WRGKWRLNDIQVKSKEYALPALEGKGTLQTLADAFSLSGEFKSKDNTHRTIFKFYMPSNKLKLLYATLPWKGGTLTVKNVLIPLKSKQPVKTVLHVQQVSIGALMQILTGERVSATGSISGDLPLVIGRDGTVSFGKGKLQADSPGTITMPADAIPGDNAQIALTRDILKNFHYGTLSISINSDADGKVPILIALEGNNPDMYNGRQVKINVRLGGDVIDFIKQNVMILTYPKSMLK
ncbi:MAG: YdbH domain-containing protein, partial [Alphaproteobacteria bacterium]|nr:YdbH domain-containing protein [Alphaproteobacteria bacterium]